MATRRERAGIAAELAVMHDGVMHRRDLNALGVGWRDVRAEVAAGRWFAVGRQTVSLTPVMPLRASLWRAVWESGPRSVLDGAASLIAAGLVGFTLTQIDVAAPKGQRSHPVDGVRVRQRRVVGAVTIAGLPRTKAEPATIRAAAWAASDRQAALIVCLAVQQRLVSADRLLQAWQEVAWVRRRTVLDRTIRDVCAGAQSLGELDFTAMCREVGIPPPVRQVIVELPSGRCYLDAQWPEARLAVEVDGEQHSQGFAPSADALRTNDILLLQEDTLVLRITLLNIRFDREQAMLQLAAAYWSRRHRFQQT